MSRSVLQVALMALLTACGTPSSGADSRAATGQRPFQIVEVATFDAPWAMTFLPGSGVRLTNAALVSEKGGRLWLVNATTGARQAVAGVPTVKVAGQGGLGDVVAHPGFAGNRRIYLSFAEAGPGGTSGAAVGYGRLILGPGAPRIAGFKIIWRQSPKVAGNGHFGHRLAFTPDGGTLFVSSGERQEMAPAQDMATTLGKIVRMSDEGANPKIWTAGHRNPLGLAFAPDGRLWSTEMGPEGGDELNLIVQGRNYGWPLVSYGSHYGGADIPDDHRARRFEEPKIWWTSSISPGGMMIYTGDLFPKWKGDALIGALSGKAFVRVDIDGAKARKADQWPMGARIRAVDQGPGGEVYLLEDGPGARLLRLTPAR